MFNKRLYDEEDMLDEAIIPIDALNDPSNLIRDDEFNAILSNIPEGAKFVVIFDSCHSATGTREMEMFGNPYSIPHARTIDDVKNILVNNEKRELPPRPKPRFLPRTQTIEDIKMIMLDLGPTRRDISSFAGPNHVLLAGCKADQSSYDDGTHGYFTRALIANMQNGVTYNELYFSARDAVLNSSHNAQEPQLEGPDSLRNSAIFE